MNTSLFILQAMLICFSEHFMETLRADKGADSRSHSCEQLTSASQAETYLPVIKFTVLQIPGSRQCPYTSICVVIGIFTDTVWEAVL